MIFQQFYLPCLSHASYIIGDASSKEAVVVDPQRDIDQYLEFARQHELSIKYVFLTHFHADFVAGHLELQERTGAHIYLGKAAEAEYDFTPVGDGSAIELGSVRLEVLETPGHTPESISILVYEANSTTPKAVLTGDTLFIGDVGRPDLLVSFGVTEKELAGMLYDSLHNKLLKLPDDVLIYPAHGAGSFCGKQLGQESFSTLGEQRTTNYALKPMPKTQFVELIGTGQAEAPPYFAYDAVANRQRRPSLHEAMARSLKPQSLQQLIRLANGGAQILDVRDTDSYSNGHLPGSLHIGLDGKFATWAGTLLDRNVPVVIIGKRHQEIEATTRLGRIGFDNVIGYLEEVDDVFDKNRDVIEKANRISVDDLKKMSDDQNAIAIVDIRSQEERTSTGIIEGSLHIPLAQLKNQLGLLPVDKPLVVHCASGYRSSIATSILLNNGFRNVFDLAGGFSAWLAQHKADLISA